MEFVVIGGDERFAWLARLLDQRGARVATALREGVPGIPELGRGGLRDVKNAIVNCPMRLSGIDAGPGRTFEGETMPRGEGMDRRASEGGARGLPAWLLDELPDEARIFSCGPGQPPADRRVIDLWTDEALKLENARLTAEGAIAAAMRASRDALRDTRCLIVGWGRIGRALTETLVPLGVDTAVATRTEANRNRAAERGAEGVPLADIDRALPGRRLIFNTAPTMVLDGDALRHVDGDAMLIDLASAPYGIDLREAWRRGLRAWREPGLPGRYCPRSAARALLSAMERRDQGEGA